MAALTVNPNPVPADTAPGAPRNRRPRPVPAWRWIILLVAAVYFLLPLFGAVADADHPYKQALGEVERLLQDEDLNFEVYQDYRNYYSFDLRMRNAGGHETSYDRRRGVASGADAYAKIRAGASLVQLYTGFIYEGPGLIKRINKLLLDR